MAEIDVDGVVHTYAGNPKMSGEEWSKEFPAIITDAKLLRCKETGQIYPNTEEFCYRSDILEPYFGEATDGDNGPAPRRLTPDITTTLAGLSDLEAL